VRNLHELDQFRSREMELRFAGVPGNHELGCFLVPSPIDGQTLKVIASSGEGWDHVSVSRSSRCPNWPEMDHIKRLFFLDTETAMQLHVPPSEHVNHHPYCLHIWRPLGVEIPVPPSIMVGPDSAKGRG
jgi:hypothetical protein